MPDRLEAFGGERAVLEDLLIDQIDTRNSEYEFQLERAPRILHQCGELHRNHQDITNTLESENIG